MRRISILIALVLLLTACVEVAPPDEPAALPPFYIVGVELRAGEDSRALELSSDMVVDVIGTGELRVTFSDKVDSLNVSRLLPMAWLVDEHTFAISLREGLDSVSIPSNLSSSSGATLGDAHKMRLKYTRPAFGLAAVELRTGDSVSQIELQQEMRLVLTEETELRVEFTDKLPHRVADSLRHYFLSRDIRVLNDYTLAFTIKPGNTYVLPGDLRSATGDSLGTKYTVRCEFPWEDVRAPQITFYGERLFVRGDPAQVKEFPFFTDGWVALTLSRKLTPEEVMLLPSVWQYAESRYSESFGYLPKITTKISSSNQLPDFPEWIKDREGLPIESRGILLPAPENVFTLYPQGHESMAYPMFIGLFVVLAALTSYLLLL